MKIGKLFGRDDLPTFQMKEVLDPDYLDITNVYHWFKLEELEKDFLYRRTQAISYIVSVGGFDNLDELNQSYAAKNYCVGPSDRIKLFTESEQEEYWYHFVINSEQCRKERWDKAKAFVSFRLSVTDSTDISLTTTQLNENYIKYGIESNSSDGNDGLIDWLESTGSYSGGTGFSSKTYYTEELKNGIIDRLNGLY
jgi:hypothetical protein